MVMENEHKFKYQSRQLRGTNETGRKICIDSKLILLKFIIIPLNESLNISH